MSAPIEALAQEYAESVYDSDKHTGETYFEHVAAFKAGAKAASGQEITTQQAVQHLIKALKSDEGYWISWQANIAMAFYDEVRKEKYKDPSTQLHEISNQAATNFLNNLTYQALSGAGKGEGHE